MKICIVTGGHYSAHNAGLPIQAARLADRLAEQGHEVHYLARNLDPEFTSCRYALSRIDSPSALHRFGFWTDAPWLLSRLNSISPDAIYQRGLQAYTGIAAWYARRNKRRFVYHVASDYDAIPYQQHDVRFLHGMPFIEGPLGVYGLKNADVVVAQTHAQQTLLQANYQRNAVVIPNHHPVPPLGADKSDAELEIAWIGNFKPLKRPELFVRLAEDLQQMAHVRFTMYGNYDAPGFSDLVAQGRRLPRLEIAGARSQGEVNALLDRAHLLVNTSLFEGFSNTFIEAWMRRVPVLTVGVNPDGLLDQQTLGLCAEDYCALKQNLVTMINDSVRRNRMAEASREIAVRDYSMTNADRVISALLGD